MRFISYNWEHGHYMGLVYIIDIFKLDFHDTFHESIWGWLVMNQPLIIILINAGKSKGNIN